MTRQFTVTRVQAEETYELRVRVLHGGGPPEMARVEGEDHPGVVTFAARDTDGTVVGCAGLFPDEGWRIRRLATASEWRGRGVATSVVTAALDHVTDRGGGVVWCHATPAGEPVFARLGFVAVGERWTDREFGPNVRMWRDVGPR